MNLSKVSNILSFPKKTEARHTTEKHTNPPEFLNRFINLSFITIPPLHEDKEAKQSPASLCYLISTADNG